VTPAEDGGTARRRPDALGWAFALLAVLYAYGIHQGIGPDPISAEPSWYHPRGFLLRWSWFSWALETSGRLMLVLTLPALALTAAVFLSGRSAVARGLALSAVVATLLFLFYGDVATGVWEFFHWRASAVLALMALAVGFAIAAPFLAASWLRFGWPLRLALFLPVCFALIAFIRNATGTDPSLRFAISPWPAVPVFGIEVGALFVMVWYLGAALGVGGVARARARDGGSAALPLALGVLLGIGVPVALLAAGSALSLLPFKAGAGTLGTVAVACALAIALSSSVGVGRQPEALRRRTRHLAVGAALIAVPLVVGQVWARWDYYWTREHRAREIIDAMERYLEKEEIYPDELEDLVKDGYLDEVPEPFIGFGFLYDGHFRYRSFGTSFILEFPAPRWVECAYTPPYVEEDEEYESEDGDEEKPLGASDEALGLGGDDESLDEAWSCPSKPPELW
jgi:hypothetical protein